MPFRALLRHDLNSLASSWLVRFWFILAGLLTLLIIAPGWPHLQTAPFIASILVPFLVLPWCVVVLVLAVNPVTGTRVEVLADGILCRPITRLEYLLAAWAARLVAVLGVYLVVTVPAILLVTFANRPAAPDQVTLYGVLAALAVVGLVQTFLVTMGFLLGTLLRSTMLAMAVVLLVWMPVNLVLSAFSLEEVSPLSLSQALPTLLRTPWREGENKSAETASNPLQDADEDAVQFLAILSGTSAAPRRPPEPEYFDQTRYTDFSLTRVVLGYAIPTLLFMLVASWIFCNRDF